MLKTYKHFRIAACMLGWLQVPSLGNNLSCLICFKLLHAILLIWGVPFVVLKFCWVVSLCGMESFCRLFLFLLSFDSVYYWWCLFITADLFTLSTLYFRSWCSMSSPSFMLCRRRYRIPCSFTSKFSYIKFSVSCVCSNIWEAVAVFCGEGWVSW